MKALLKAKEEREKEEAMHIEETHTKIGYREIEMLKVIFCIWWRGAKEGKIISMHACRVSLSTVLSSSPYSSSPPFVST